ncbi:hypothetical protein AGMMS4957_19590 [Bacteroidia bacterium]|nr:hypothetical protein AGMMS4957_19590 [Bacteroidia bacterium]
MLLKFPVSYGDETKSYYYSHGVHGNFFELNDMGTVKFHADAYGMMVMPDKDTLKNVLRTHTIKHTVSDVTTISNEYVQKDTAWYYISPDSIDFRVASNDIIFVDEIFRWYAKGYRYPVFETVSSWVKRPDNSIVEQLQKKSFFYPPEEHYYLETDAENLAQLKPHDPDAGFTYNFSPNPVKETPLNVELYLPKPAKNIRLQLRTLTGVLVLEENKGSLSAGIRHLQLNTSTVPAGNYIFVIVRDGHSVGKVLLKR